MSASATDDTFYLGTMRDGDYAWKPFSNAAGALLYFDSKTAALSLDTGYAALVAGQADFAVQDAHGYWGKSGRLSIAWAESTPIRTILYWSNGCAVGNLDHADNFLSSVLYSPTSDVLVARGSTNDSGGMGNNTNGFFGKNIATRMSQGGSFGEALLYHMNTPLIAPVVGEPGEFQLAPSSRSATRPCACVSRHPDALDMTQTVAAARRPATINDGAACSACSTGAEVGTPTPSASAFRAPRAAGRTCPATTALAERPSPRRASPH